MAIALVAHTTVAGIGTAGTTTTPAIDTTGATLLVVAVTYYAASGGVPTISDSKGNAWTMLTAYGGGAGASSVVALYYAANPTVGTGHTFSAANTVANFAPIAALAFSGARTVSPLDVETGASVASATTLAPGSLTPAGDNEVFVTSFGYGLSDTPTVDSGFAITDNVDYTASVTFGQSVAYLVQGTAGALNPTWTRTNASGNSAALAAFKPLVAVVLPRDLAHSPQWQPLIAQ